MLRPALLVLLLAPSVASALPVPGDLDGDARASVRDAVLLARSLGGDGDVPRDLADLDQDGAVAVPDVAVLVDIALGGPLPAAFLTRVTTSPAGGESDVAVTREMIVRLGRPLLPGVVPTPGDLFATFGGDVVPARLHVSADRRTLTLFQDAPLPAAARIRLNVLTASLLDPYGLAPDGDEDGTPGGDTRSDFETLSLATVPGTAVYGRVFASELDESGGGSVNTPLQGVAITVDAAPWLRATTDAAGNFRLDPAPAGRFFVHVDGRTATNGVPEGAYYPFVGKAWETTPGEEADVGDIFLPLVPPGTLQPVSDAVETTVRFSAALQDAHPDMASTSVTVPPRSLFGDDGTFGGEVGIAPVPPDRLPGRLPPGLDFPVVITVQTDGPANFDVPVRACFPNLPTPRTAALMPGDKSALWSFNHDTGRFEVIGPMTVTDGGLACTDEGVGILAPGWHGSQPGSQPRTPEPDPPPEDECEPFGLADLWAIAKAVFDCVRNLSRALQAIGAVIDVISSISTISSSIKTLYTGYGNGSLTVAEVKAAVEALKATKDSAKSIYEAFTQSNAISKAIDAIACGTNIINTIVATLCDHAECIGSAAVRICAVVTRLLGLVNTLVQNVNDLQKKITDAPLTAVCLAFDGLVDVLGSAQGVARSAEGDPDPAVLEAMATTIAEGDAFTATVGPAAMATMDRLADMDADLRAIDGYLWRMAAGRGGFAEARYRLTVGSGPGAIVQRGVTNASGEVVAQVQPSAPYVLEMLSLRERVLAISEGTTPPNGAQGEFAPFLLTFLDDEPDADADVLPDVAEPVVGTDPGMADSDGDGTFDGAEVLAGTDPLDGQAVALGLVATAQTPGNAIDVAACDGFVAVADRAEGVSVFNVYRGMPPIAIARVDTIGSATAVACDGSLVLVADGPGGLAIVDIADPGGASVVERIPMGDSAIGVAAAGGVAYVAAGSSVVEVDLVTRTERRRVDLGSTVQDVALHGDLVLALRPGTLTVLDRALTVLGTAPAPGQTGAGMPRWRLFAGNGLVHAVHSAGYDTLDVTDPAAPALIAAGSTTQFGWRHLAADGSGLAVAAVDANSTDDGPHDVSLYDVADPSRTDVFLTTLPTPGVASAVALESGLAYVADGAAGMQVMRYRLPESSGAGPTVSLVTNATGGSVQEGATLRLTALADDDVLVREVEFLSGDAVVARDASFPFEQHVVAPSAAEAPRWRLRARAYDTQGRQAVSAEVVVDVLRDTTPPEIVGRAPDRGQLVGAVTAVQVAFGEAVVAQSVSLAVLAPGADGAPGADDVAQPGTLAWDPLRRRATFTLAAPLEPGLWSARVAPGVRDLAGNATAAADTWTFTVDRSVDSDDDGLADFDELRYGLDPHALDSDGDGTYDGDEDDDEDQLDVREELEAGTDPRLADTDGDGTPDGAEVFAGCDPLVPQRTRVVVRVRDRAAAAVAGARVFVVDGPAFSALTDAAGVATIDAAPACLPPAVAAVSGSSRALSRRAAPVLGGTTDLGTVVIGPWPPYPARKLLAGAMSDLSVTDADADGDQDVVVLLQRPFGPANASVATLVNDGLGEVALTARTSTGAGEFFATGDFTGDGVPDCVVASGYPSSTASIAVGRGDGRFARPRSFPTGTWPRAVAVADFDADGRRDAVTADVGSDSASVLLGFGDGTLGTPSQAPAGDVPLCVATGDFDEDGAQDAVVGSQDSGAVMLLRGNGDGTLDAGVTLVAGAPVPSVAVGDVDRDGHLDVVSTTGCDELNVLLGRGDGTFESLTSCLSGTGLNRQGVALADVTGDGLLDIVAADTGTGEASILPGLGDGTFGAELRVRALASAMRVAAADLQGDGPDVLALSSLGLVELRGPTFEPTGGWPLASAAGTAPLSVAAADLDGDGDQDVVAANYLGADVSVLLGRGDGTFEPERRFAVGEGPRVAGLADLDGDGLRDIVTVNAQGDDASVLLGTGGGAFAAQARFAVGDGPESAVLGDFDGDGDLDLAAQERSGTTGVAILAGDGAGRFAAPVRVAAPTGVTLQGSLDAGDIDGDGDLDVVSGGSRLTVLRNDGATFTISQPLTPGHHVAVADFDGDGLADVAATAQPPAAGVYVHRGTPSGLAYDHFQTAGAEPSSIMAADLDADGAADLVMTNQQDQDFSLLHGWGDLRFAPEMRFAARLLPYGSAAADFDGDGLTDLAVVGQDGVVLVYLRR